MLNQLLNPGQTGTTSGYPAKVIRRYSEGMYEVRVPGGLVCIPAEDFVPDEADPVQDFCQANNLDQGAVESLLSFMRSGLEKPEGRAMLAAQPAEFARAGMEAWFSKGKAFYEELIAGDTPRAIEYRKAIAGAVWEQAQTNGARGMA